MCGTPPAPMPTTQKSDVIRFGPFEADLYTRELRRNGRKLRLQEQPFQVLAMLLERPGELVTREQIRARLWPQDTFVDFDHGLNAAVRRLREALNDNAGTPRFVETLRRRGYRIIAPVSAVEPPLPPRGRSSGAARERPTTMAGTMATARPTFPFMAGPTRLFTPTLPSITTIGGANSPARKCPGECSEKT